MVAKYIVLVAALCALIGCSKKEDPALWGKAALTGEQTIKSLAAFQNIAESARTSPPAQRLTLTQFFGNIQLTAYEKLGRKNPRWDNEARQFLSLSSTNFLRGAFAETTESASQLPELADAAA